MMKDILVLRRENDFMVAGILYGRIYRMSMTDFLQWLVEPRDYRIHIRSIVWEDIDIEEIADFGILWDGDDGAYISFLNLFSSANSIEGVDLD